MKTISYIAAIFFLFLSLHLPAQTKRALVIGLGVPKGQIAIARDFALVLNDDGRQRNVNTLVS